MVSDTATAVRASMCWERARLVNDVKHWRDRAADMRVLSTMMKDIETQAIMARLADDYDTLAERAEQRANGEIPARS